ncbi:excinuclease [Burkholderia ubonensis]|uniref:Excinuclease n=1 Tax=Burkholderia ubonensis TaxID=101571 RepID=A0A102JSK0_9BURK|nr:GIY-YIG nuclease family protein [Burkholderia ubonensis]KUZ62498.1 excinuclease [Burkholderia ubonensis]KUZ87158.1 excinuclease [Burkholderia ubonensis]KUZ87823.1 excinuclease [Burkholderia ubonensis]KUZ90674.1 excinuclease [Burkholderia ubonensis]
MSWFLYLIECADGSVYTGITTDVAARFDEHAAGKGARYTRSRKPRAVLASFPLADRSSASRAEYWVKQLSPKQKRELAAGMRTLESVLPVVAAVADDADGDGDGEEKAAPARASRKRAPKGDVTATDDAVAVDQAGPNGDAPKRGRAAAKQSPTRTGPAAKATPKARTRAAAKPRPASGPTPAPTPAPKKTARAKQNRAAS